MGVERNLSEVRHHFSNWAAVHRDVEDVLRFESRWEIGPRCEAFREIGNACREAVQWLRAEAEAEPPDSISWWRWVDARAALRRLRRDYA